ncbi:plasmid pRiA4b ORF-3 family protein [Tardiphaga sp. vice352]|uniref:plasmid pRiA4b ORF-3 family protein n=1 Tax=unclassified Tardiphaga TaxID=2631404 RepID=UPI0011643448|nr:MULTISPECIES: plasmid pRiA4b ORF-3 family protein [unclassified Tardiphaga]QDM15411.1 plasmid pRiA4b ORF-3 family protein [Tardiphaga sp. vice278]QDM25593.1 plasmid pRiA4b ORF-3 family protein [Tardiphaga sp. vice304]QDM30800.1 plasmid pRiA4b ORF-3 family protein [Tardiphaga sp. vice352]
MNQKSSLREVLQFVSRVLTGNKADRRNLRAPRTRKRRDAGAEVRYGERWGIPDPDGDFGSPPIDVRKARLCDIVQETGAKMIHYLYDFSDSWDHVIKLEKWLDNTTTEGLPLLLEAAGRCPPKDVGGAPGYAEYLDAISDPAHPEHEHMRIWGPERFDPNVIDRETLKAAVNALSGIWKPRRHKLRSK